MSDKNNKQQQLLLLIIVVLLIISAIVVFFIYNSQKQTLSLKNDDLKKESQEIGTQDEETSVSVFFNNSKYNPNSQDCSKVFAVKRSVKEQEDMITLVLNELFKGPLAEEKNKNYHSIFTENTKDILISAKKIDNTVYINLKDIRGIIPNANSSCNISHFFASVNSTLKQFGNINNVIFAIDGNPEIFYEWMQIGCIEENDFCDDTPFQDMIEKESVINNEAKNEDKNQTKLKICPDAWYDNQMPSIGEEQEANQYFIINQERRELTEFDIEWIKQNCPVNQPEIVQ